MTALSSLGAASRGRWWSLARLAFAAVALLTAGLFIASIPADYEYHRNACLREECFGEQLTPEQARAIQAMGYSADFFALYLSAINVVFAAVFLAIVVAICVLKPADGPALFAALTLVTFGGIFSGSLDRLAAGAPAWRLPIQLVQFIGDASILIFLYTFPDGRFVSRWARVLAFAWIATRIPEHFFQDSSFNLSTWSRSVYFVIFLGFVASGLVAQVHRYWRVSNPRQRQQTKWVVAGTAAALGI